MFSLHGAIFNVEPTTDDNSTLSQTSECTLSVGAMVDLESTTDYMSISFTNNRMYSLQYLNGEQF